MKKIVWIIVSILLVAGMIGGCVEGDTAESEQEAATSESDTAETTQEDEPAQEDEEPAEIVNTGITIEYMTSEADDAVDEIMIAYEKYIENVAYFDIDKQIVANDDYVARMAAMMETDTCPDLYWHNGTHIVEGLKNTDSVIDLTANINRDDFVDGAFGMLETADGKIAGYPSYMETQGWFINKAVFEEYNLEIPTTYEELLECVDVFAANGIATFAMGTLENWATWGFVQWFQLWGLDEQAEQLFVDGTLDYSDADFTEVYYKLAELRERGAFPENCSTINFEQMKTMLLTGEAAMLNSYSAALADVIGTEQDNGDIIYNWGVTFEDSSYPQNIAIKMVGNGFGIGSQVADDPEKLDLLNDFMKYMYSDEVVQAIFDATGKVMPVVYDFKYTVDSPILKSQVAMLQDDRIGTITHAYASLKAWGSDTEIWLPFYSKEGDVYLGLMDGSITRDDIPSRLEEINSTVNDCIDTYNASISE